MADASMSSWDQVLEFHQATGATINGQWPPTPEEAALRINLIYEELQELRDALIAGDIIETADALADLDYVVNGAAVAFGLHLPTITTAVHHSNMTKLDENGDPVLREDGKVLKSHLYEPPKIQEAILASNEVLKGILNG